MIKGATWAHRVTLWGLLHARGKALKDGRSSVVDQQGRPRRGYLGWGRCQVFGRRSVSRYSLGVGD